MSRKKEGKEKVPNPILSLEEIGKTKALPVERSPKHRRILTAEKKFDLFVESCQSPGRLGEMLRREGLYHTDLARIRVVVEEGALAALRSVRPGRNKKPSVSAEAHEALLREKEEVERALASLAMENQALKKSLAWGFQGSLRGIRLEAQQKEELLEMFDQAHRVGMTQERLATLLRVERHRLSRWRTQKIKGSLEDNLPGPRQAPHRLLQEEREAFLALARSGGSCRCFGPRSLCLRE